MKYNCKTKRNTNWRNKGNTIVKPREILLKALRPGVGDPVRKLCPRLQESVAATETEAFCDNQMKFVWFFLFAIIRWNHKSGFCKSLLSPVPMKGLLIAFLIFYILTSLFFERMTQKQIVPMSTCTVFTLSCDYSASFSLNMSEMHPWSTLEVKSNNLFADGM